MSKRNFILFIIILVIILIGIFGFLYLRRTPTPPPATGGTNFGSEFNPFGQTTPAKTPPATTPPNNTPPDNTPPTSTLNLKLIKISTMPIAGFAVYQKERYKDIPVVTPDATVEPTTTTPVVPTKTTTKTKVPKPTPPPTEIMPALRYVARSNGNIYETFADKVEERQFSSTVIPKIYEALFGNNGDTVVMRYLKVDGTTIQTLIGALPKELLGGDTTSSNTIKGSFLPDKISDLSSSPDNSKIFYLLGAGDGVVGITAGTAGDKKVQVFDSPFAEWLSQWANAKMITLTTKPSYAVPGYMYAINPDKKDFNKVLGDIAGLTTLTSPDGKMVLYADSNLSTNIYNVSTGATTPLSIKTLPEKCVWNTSSTNLYCAVPKATGAGLYPDQWYQGEVSFIDEIWKIDTATGRGSMLLDPITAAGGESVDGTKLALDASEKYLLFVNKKDSYLWELNLQAN